MAKFEPVENNTGMDPVGNDYSQVDGLTFESLEGISFDPSRQAPIKSYAELQHAPIQSYQELRQAHIESYKERQERERADRDRRENEERESRRITETAINIALMGACLGGGS